MPATPLTCNGSFSFRITWPSGADSPRRRPLHSKKRVIGQPLTQYPVQQEFLLNPCAQVPWNSFLPFCTVRKKYAYVSRVEDEYPKLQQ